ncbi:MAG: hypothetical protein WBD31_28650 [Rubripirellula sp.]
MLMSPGQAESPLTKRVHDWQPVEFIPLDEPTAYKQLDAYFERTYREALCEAAGIDDEALIDALIDAGFSPETIPALQLVPIAFAAWASGSVTDEECQAAVWSIYESRLLEQPVAASRVQNWIDVRPGQELWDLWVEYTECRLLKMPPIIRQLVGKQLLEQATAVALASGGYFGIGKVCAAEQTILDAIAEIYRIE